MKTQTLAFLGGFLVSTLGCTWIYSGATRTSLESVSNSGGGVVVQEKVITVDPTEAADLADASAGDGVCATSNSKCSFAAALSTSTEYTQPVRIVMPAGTYATNTSYTLSKQNLTIEGVGSTTILDYTGTSTFLTANATDITIKNLLIDGPTTASANIRALNANRSNFILDAVTIQNFVSTAGINYGAGISISSGDNIQIKNSVITGNANAYRGGGMHIVAGSGDITNLLIENCVFSNNSTSSLGAHLYVRHAHQLTMTIRGTSFLSSSGGGVSVSFDDSSWIGTGSTILIENSLFSSNAGMALRVEEVENVTVRNTTFNGGTGSAVRYVNTNSAPSGSDFTFVNNTVSTNTGAGTPAVASVINDAAYTFYLQNSIVSNSGVGGDCITTGTPRFTTSHSIFRGASCPAGTGTIASTDPQLTALASNGGPVQTMLPNSPGSAAIDAASNAVCTSTDARGLPRPVNKVSSLTCDMGAVEVQ